MLVPAYPLKAQLDILHPATVWDPAYKFYHTSFPILTIDLKPDAFREIQMCSVDKDYQVIGYLSCEIYRPENYAAGFEAINYSKDPKDKITFGKDMWKFLSMMFDDFRFHKFKFNVIAGNPIENTYRRLVAKAGGREVGVFKKDIMLNDNILYDRIFFEILREDYKEKQK